MSDIIVHVVPGLGRNQGGPSYSVPSLCAGLTRAGATVRLFAVENSSDPVLVDTDAHLCRHDYRNIPIVGQLRASSDLRRKLRPAASSAGIMHVHGIWLLPNVEAGMAARRSGIPLVVSPRGMLAHEALKISKARKQLFWKFLQERAYADAALWHATCDAEVEEIRAFGIRAPAAVIPNGIDLPILPPSGRKAGNESRTVLYLGRIHPKKNLTSLVIAWSRVATEHPRWRLRIVGPDENGHAAQLIALASQLGLQNLSVEPPAYGADKEHLLAEASLFVLPTLNENFGIAVAEALGACVPAIVTKGAPWPGLAENACGWWIDHGVEPLAETLNAAMSLSPSHLRSMGERGRSWMARDFGWDALAEDMLAVYDWLSGRGQEPVTVRRA